MPPPDLSSSHGLRHRKRPRTVAAVGGVRTVADRYQLVSRLGRGTYGVVYKALDTITTHKSNNHNNNDSSAATFVTLKRCRNNRNTQEYGVSVLLLREIECLQQCAACPYTVTLLSVVNTTSTQSSSSTSSVPSVCLILNYCRYDLAQVIDAHYARHRHHHGHSNRDDPTAATNNSNNSNSPFAPAVAKTLFVQLLSALSFLHARCIWHRDVKLSNLLYHYRHHHPPIHSPSADTSSNRNSSNVNNSSAGAGGRLVLADFGLARHWSHLPPPSSRRRPPTALHSTAAADTAAATNDMECNTTHNTTNINTPLLTFPVASLWYRPPELLWYNNNRSNHPHITYTSAIDVWAAGCAFVEFGTGQPAWAGTNEQDQRDCIVGFGNNNNNNNNQRENSSSRHAQQFVREERRHPLRPNYSQLWERSWTSSSSNNNNTLSESGQELLVNVLQFDPRQRWTADQALRSPYFTTELPLPCPEPHMPRLFEL